MSVCTCIIVNGVRRSTASWPCPVHMTVGEKSPPEFGPIRPAPEMELAAVKEVVKELTGKLQLLVEWVDSKGLLEDHCFTFPDGDVWKAQDVPVKDGRV